MICIVEGCGHSIHARGLCNAHYRRSLAHGDPLAGKRPANKATTSAPFTTGFACACGGRTDVKDSRQWNGFIRRRRRCTVCSSSFSTVEVPESAFKAINKAALLVQMASATEALNTFIHRYNAVRRSIRRSGDTDAG